MNSKINILITGGAGYVGSVLTRFLLKKGYRVRVLDPIWFKEDTPLNFINDPNYEFIRGSLLDQQILTQVVKDVDYIFHTAAVVGDPASKLFPELTTALNKDASTALVESAKKENVKGFFFFSTCSNYGMTDGMATEESALNPLSLYADTKVDIEKYLMESSGDMDWVIGRLSTVYGSSPRMRFDLTVNDFTLKAFRDKYIDIFLPESYRPYIHVYDLANVMTQLVNSFESVKNNVFNIGFEGENYQKIEIANATKAVVPDVKIDILKEGGDKRDYQVDFSKLQKFIAIKNHYTVEKSVKEMFQILKQGLIIDSKQSCYYNTEPNMDAVYNPQFNQVK